MPYRLYLGNKKPPNVTAILTNANLSATPTLANVTVATTSNVSTLLTNTSLSVSVALADETVTTVQSVTVIPTNTSLAATTSLGNESVVTGTGVITTLTNTNLTVTPTLGNESVLAVQNVSTLLTTNSASVSLANVSVSVGTGVTTLLTTNSVLTFVGDESVGAGQTAFPATNFATTALASVTATGVQNVVVIPTTNSATVTLGDETVATSGSVSTTLNNTNLSASTSLGNESVSTGAITIPASLTVTPTLANVTAVTDSGIIVPITTGLTASTALSSATTVVTSANVYPTTNAITVVLGDETVAAAVNVSTLLTNTSLSATPAINGVTVTTAGNVTATGQVDAITTDLNNVTVTGSANVFPSTNFATVSLASVTASGVVNISTTLTTNSATVALASVTVATTRNVAVPVFGDNIPVGLGVIPGGGGGPTLPPLAFVQSAEGATTASNPVGLAFSTAPTAGNLIVLAIAAGAYNYNPDAGWFQAVENRENTGSYLWWRISDGSNSFTFTTNPTAYVSWVMAEFEGGDQIDATTVLEGLGGGATATTASVVPSTGERLVIAALGGNQNTDLSGDVTSWTNGFTHVRTAGHGPTSSTQNTIVGMAYKIVTGDDTTGVSTGGTYPAVLYDRIAQIASFKGVGDLEPLVADPSLDNFDRANGNLESAAASGGWSWSHDGAISGAFVINSNQIGCTTTNSTGSAYKSPDVASLNQYVQYKVLNRTNGTGPFACCRLADSNNFIGIRVGAFALGGGELEVYRRVSGSLTSLYSSSNVYANGDIVRLEVSGTGVSGDAWRVYRNGTLLTSGTIGAALTSTRQGLVARATVFNPWADDYEAGELILPPAVRSLASLTYAGRTDTTVSKPTGTVDGDILLVAMFAGNSSTINAVTPPTGFKLLQKPNHLAYGGFHGELYVYWKRASGEPSSYTFSHSTNSTQIVMLAVSGCVATGNPIDSFAFNWDTGGILAAGWSAISPNQTNTLGFAINHNWSGNPQDVFGSGILWTEHYDTVLLKVQTRTYTARGDTTSLGPGSDPPWSAYHLALRGPAEAPTGGGGTDVTVTLTNTSLSASVSLGNETVATTTSVSTTLTNTNLSATAALGNETVSTTSNVSVTVFGEFVSVALGDETVDTASGTIVTLNNTNLAITPALGNETVVTTTNVGTTLNNTNLSATVALNNVTVSAVVRVDVEVPVSVGEWSPDMLSGLNVWLDASQLGLANNAPVTAWDNLSGGTDPAIVGTPEPVMKTATLNGLPVVRFTGNEGRLRGSGGPTLDYTITYVVRQWGSTPGRAFSSQYPPTNYLLGFHTSVQDAMYDNGWVAAGSGYGTPPGPWKMYGAHATTALGSRFFKDGAIIANQTPALAQGIGGTWALSGYSTTGLEETGDFEVAEFVMYDVRLAGTDRQMLEGYLAWKWGLEANLVPGHAYESAPPTGAGEGQLDPLTVSLGGVTVEITEPPVSELTREGFMLTMRNWMGN
jgi:hypothetical protein